MFKQTEEEEEEEEEEKRISCKEREIKKDTKNMK